MIFKCFLELFLLHKSRFIYLIKTVENVSWGEMFIVSMIQRNKMYKDKYYLNTVVAIQMFFRERKMPTFHSIH